MTLIEQVVLSQKKIIFVTGTRADFGKMKGIMKYIDQHSLFDAHIYVTGMHTLKLYGSTYREVKREGYNNLYHYVNQHLDEPMESILANTISGLSRFVHEIEPDLIVVHGDRVEALAGALVGSLANILVCHIEGGELSGTVDEMIRHSISKLAHIHLVANLEAQKRLIQMGENEQSIFVIGSPDLDVMLSEELPGLENAKHRYDIPFKHYAIAMFHPVTTEIDKITDYAKQFFEALQQTKHNYIVVYPNNDQGSHQILSEIKKLESNSHMRIFPSIRFEYFLTLLKNATYIIGNSSAGIREAPFYGVPCINIGTRQSGRFTGKSVVNVDYSTSAILKAVQDIQTIEVMEEKGMHFGSGNSLLLFSELIESQQFWNVKLQKVFIDKL